MTKASMALADLDETRPDADLLRPMIRFVAQRLMDRDVEALCRVAYGERRGDRINSRNDFRARAQFDIVRRRGGSVSVLGSITVNTPSR
jgi:putative transposase